MNKQTFFIAVLLSFAIISLVLNGILVYLLVKTSQVYQQQQAKAEILSFRNIFEQKVLLSGKEVDFDTRLSLETAVRNLDNPAILSQWEKFTNCQTQIAATAEAKALLELLIRETSF